MLLRSAVLPAQTAPFIMLLQSVVSFPQTPFLLICGVLCPLGLYHTRLSVQLQKTLHHPLSAPLVPPSLPRARLSNIKCNHWFYFTLKPFKTHRVSPPDFTSVTYRPEHMGTSTIWWCFEGVVEIISFTLSQVLEMSKGNCSHVVCCCGTRPENPDLRQVKH